MDYQTVAQTHGTWLVTTLSSLSIFATLDLQKISFSCPMRVPKGSNSLVLLQQLLTQTLQQNRISKPSIRCPGIRFAGCAALLHVEPDLRLKPEQVWIEAFAVRVASQAFTRSQATFSCLVSMWLLLA